MLKEFTEENYPLKNLTEKIIAAAFKVHNTLGSGFVEKVYENALAEELRQQGRSIFQQKGVAVQYNGTPVGEFRTDLIVDDAVIVEIKAVKNFDRSFEDKLLHYLRSTNHKVGLIINFADKVYVRRKVNSSANPSVQSAES